MHPSIDDYQLLKNWGNMTTAKEKCLKFYFAGGTWQRGDYDKGYYGIWFYFSKAFQQDFDKFFNLNRIYFWINL